MATWIAHLRLAEAMLVESTAVYLKKLWPLISLGIVDHKESFQFLRYTHRTLSLLCKIRGTCAGRLPMPIGIVEGKKC
jgi:hypothetical protein